MRGGAGLQPAEGSETLYLKCNTAVQDCAVFLQSQRTAFEARGYTATFPGAARPELGFAYPVADADGDTLPDAMERLLGTALNLPDSDGDGQSDAAEYPLGSAPVSDPCAGPNVRCTRAADRVFRSGFE